MESSCTGAFADYSVPPLNWSIAVVLVCSQARCSAMLDYSSVPSLSALLLSRSLSLARYRFLMVRCFRAISAVGSRRLRRSSGAVNSRGAPAPSTPPPLPQSQVSQQPGVLAEKSGPPVASVACATPSGQSGDGAVVTSVGDPSAVAPDDVTQAEVPSTSEGQTAPVT